MKIISYSLTGNNEALANSIAEAMSAQHITVQPEKERSYGRIGMDMIFNKAPKVKPVAEDVAIDDFIIFMGPVWMGMAASPLRSYFKRFKKQIKRYAFISVSGGADGGNPKLNKELTKRLGVEPALILDFHIAELLPEDSEKKREETSSYRLTEADIKALTEKAVNAIKEKL